MSSVWSEARGRMRNTAPFSAASTCHGTRLLWCSICVTTISSPGPMFWRAHVFATRLIDSVALRVQITHSGEPAPMNRATLARASS